MDKLRDELAEAKDHLRKSAATFTNVGRLHTFLEERRKAVPLKSSAPLAAMKYIQALEKACRVAQAVLSGTDDDIRGAQSLLEKTLRPDYE